MRHKRSDSAKIWVVPIHRESCAKLTLGTQTLMPFRRPMLFAGVVLLALALVLVPLAFGSQSGPAITIEPEPNVTIQITCPNGTTIAISSPVDPQSVYVACGINPTPVPTLPPPRPAPVPTTVPELVTYNGVAVCTAHDPTRYHHLVERNADNSIRCTYLHEHHDDPHVLDGLLGPLGAWFGPGQEISYPWQTSSTAGLENEAKHTFYKWIVRKDLQPTFNGNTTQAYFRNLRVQYHWDGIFGYATQFHSFSAEGEACDKQNVCGKFRLGGHQDVGEHLLSHDPPNDTPTCVIPDPNLTRPHSLCGDGIMVGARMLHGAPTDSRRDATWYSTQATNHTLPGIQAISFDAGVIGGTAGGIIVQTDGSVSTQLFVPYPGNQYTQTYLSAEVLGLAFVGFPADASGHITAQGFTDPHGNVTTACTVAGAGCIPFALSNMPRGPLLFRDSEYRRLYGVDLIQRHDVLTADGKTLVQLPN